MKLLFIAGPYRDPRGPWYIRQNIEAARQAAAVWWQRGYAVLCPHVNTEMMDGLLQDEAYLEGALEMLVRCDGIVLLPGWEQSEGARRELWEAENRGLLVFEHPDPSPVPTQRMAARLLR